MLQKRTVKGIGFQMRLKPVGQLRQLGGDMVVADGTPGLLPNLLLWVEVRRPGRKLHNFQTRVGSQQYSDGRPPMPRSPVPEHDHPLAWMSVEGLLEVLGGRLGVQVGGPRDEFLTRPQVQAA